MDGRCERWPWSIMLILGCAETVTKELAIEMNTGNNRGMRQTPK
jgi:hypothetical protein